MLQAKIWRTLYTTTLWCERKLYDEVRVMDERVDDGLTDEGLSRSRMVDEIYEKQSMLIFKR